MFFYDDPEILTAQIAAAKDFDVTVWVSRTGQQARL
jgi:hypothetical protein